MFNNEDWKVYKFENDNDDKARYAFSRYGEIMSFTKNHPEGNIINGGLTEGYPIVKFERLKPLTDEAEKSISEKETAISEIRKKLKPLKYFSKKKTTIGKDLDKALREINQLTAELEKISSKLSKERKKVYKKRRIFVTLLVHKAVAELFIPNDDPVNKKFVIHKNFDKKDNRVENLAWATNEEVVKRSFESPNYISFKINKPRRNPTLASKLDYNDVIFIKRKLEKGEPMARLARRFGVSDMQIHRIKTGENWGDVKPSSIDTKNN